MLQSVNPIVLTPQHLMHRDWHWRLKPTQLRLSVIECLFFCPHSFFMYVVGWFLWVRLPQTVFFLLIKPGKHITPTLRVHSADSRDDFRQTLFDGKLNYTVNASPKTLLFQAFVIYRLVYHKLGQKGIRMRGALSLHSQMPTPRKQTERPRSWVDFSQPFGLRLSGNKGLFLSILFT